MASGSTRATLATGNFLGIMNCLMQLRKVCNHPDLFEPRPIVSAFDALPGLELAVPSLVGRLAPGPDAAALHPLLACLGGGLDVVMPGARVCACSGWEAR
jgi:hypothetical protein